MCELRPARLYQEHVDAVPVPASEVLLGESSNPGRSIGKHRLPSVNRQPPAIEFSALLPRAALIQKAVP